MKVFVRFSLALLLACFGRLATQSPQGTPISVSLACMTDTLPLIEEQEVVQEIRNSGADCLFIAMPTPRKERFLSAYRHQLQVPFIMGVGGSFDVLAGEVTRAPPLMQKPGLEWLYRIYQEPGRMWWRYFRTNTIFAGMMLSALTSALGRKSYLL